MVFGVQGCVTGCRVVTVLEVIFTGRRGCMDCTRGV
jgi:hypothetical protein